MGTLVAGTASAMVFIFTSFVSVADNDAYHVGRVKIFSEFQTSLYYDQFYDMLDKYDEAFDEERFDRADEIARQMERLKAKICEEDPSWERCSPRG